VFRKSIVGNIRSTPHRGLTGRYQTCLKRGNGESTKNNCKGEEREPGGEGNGEPVMRIVSKCLQPREKVEGGRLIVGQCPGHECRGAGEIPDLKGPCGGCRCGIRKGNMHRKVQ